MPIEKQVKAEFKTGGAGDELNFQKFLQKMESIKLRMKVLYRNY